MISPNPKVDIDRPARLVPWGTPFQEQANSLLNDPWLARKVNRERRWKEYLSWLRVNLPEMFECSGKLFLDIGPGPGESLEIASLCGHNAFGVDAKCGDGGMGEDYLAYSRLMHYRQFLNVRQCESRDQFFDTGELLDYIVMRGSIEQVFSDCMIGDPHHIHHNARLLKWDTDKARFEIASFMCRLWDNMKSCGLVVISANGSQNDREYAAMIRMEAGAVGFMVDEKGCLDHRLTKISS